MTEKCLIYSVEVQTSKIPSELTVGLIKSLYQLGWIQTSPVDTKPVMWVGHVAVHPAGRGEQPAHEGLAVGRLHNALHLPDHRDLGTGQTEGPADELAPDRRDPE